MVAPIVVKTNLNLLSGMGLGALDFPNAVTHPPGKKIDQVKIPPGAFPHNHYEAFVMIRNMHLMSPEQSTLHE